MDALFEAVSWTAITAFVTAGMLAIVGLDLLFTGGKFIKRILRRA
jgi:hypothetical protein